MVKVNVKALGIFIVMFIAIAVAAVLAPEQLQLPIVLCGGFILLFVYFKFVISRATTDLLPPECARDLVALGFRPVRIDGHTARYTIPSHTSVRDVREHIPFDWPESEALPNVVIYRDDLLMAYTTGHFAEQELVLVDY